MISTKKTVRNVPLKLFENEPEGGIVPPKKTRKVARKPSRKPSAKR